MTQAHSEIPDSLAERYGISEEDYKARIDRVAAHVVEVIIDSGEPFDPNKTLVLHTEMDGMKIEGLYPAEMASLVEVGDIVESAFKANDAD